MKKIFCVILVIALLNGCNSQSNEFLEENEELRNKVILLEKNNKLLENKIDNLENKDNNFDEHSLVQNRVSFFTKEEEKYFGNYNINETILYSLPDRESSVVNFSPSEKVRVLFTVLNENNEEWIFVHCNEMNNCYGYIEVSSIMEKCASPHLEESSLKMNNGLTVGTYLDDVLKVCGTVYSRLNSVYGTSIVVNNEHGEVIYSYFADTRQVYRILINSDTPDVELENGVRVGMTFDEVSLVYSIDENSLLNKAFITINDDNDCQIILTFDSMNEVRAIEILHNSLSN